MLTSAIPATASAGAPRLEVPGSIRRAAAAAGELLAVMGVVLSVPLVILAIGLPIALCVRLLLWIAGAL